MGLNNYNCSAIDYLLGTILIYYLLFNTNYLLKIDLSRSLYLLLNSEKDNTTAFSSKEVLRSKTGIQSAGNLKESSETIRQLSNLKSKDRNFYSWLAGVIDGDGNFDIIKNPNKNSKNSLILKSIRIKLHNRDIRILSRIQDYLHCGRIRSVKNRPYSFYIVSTKEEMSFIINQINGFIRIKADAFQKACSILNIDYIEANYNIETSDPYFSGLIDTDGSIVFNYAANRIECNLELKYNDYTKKLNFDNVIQNCKPSVYLRKKHNQSPDKEFQSITFKYQTVSSMIHVYEYFMRNRLYCDMKFYRVCKIKPFIGIRKYQNEPLGSPEFKVYSLFLLDWIQYQNPLWTKVPFVKKLDKEIVH